MIRQINLKEEDWLEISHTSLGSYSLWSVGIVLSCFLGLALLALTSFVMKKRITTTRFIMTWKLLLIIKLGEQVRTFFSYISKFDGISPFLHASTQQCSYLKQDSHVLITFDDAQETNNDEECSDQETDIALTLPRATIHDMINVQIQRWLRTALQLFLC
uniref:Uncharacterized protein n=1 Tax=Brassica oleracea var. oleracea TaxID=109376 RepID=A0A0D3D703_BRAOL